jgi:hypothetical protein
MPDIQPETRQFIDALRRLIHRGELADRLMASETSEDARAELGVSPELATELKTVLLGLKNLPAADAGGDPPAESALSQARESVSTSQEFLDSSFNQLRWAYRISMAMSVLVFLVGIGFLAIAAVRTFTNPGSETANAVIGGLGIVQIVALFYRNPLRDIGIAVSNAQQSKMAVMSYMLGVTLIGEGVYGGRQTAEAISRLSGITEDAMSRMEQYSEQSLSPSESKPETSTT